MAFLKALNAFTKETETGAVPAPLLSLGKDNISFMERNANAVREYLEMLHSADDEIACYQGRLLADEVLRVIQSHAITMDMNMTFANFCDLISAPFYYAAFLNHVRHIIDSKVAMAVHPPHALPMLHSAFTSATKHAISAHQSPLAPFHRLLETFAVATAVPCIQSMLRRIILNCRNNVFVATDADGGHFLSFALTEPVFETALVSSSITECSPVFFSSEFVAFLQSSISTMKNAADSQVHSADSEFSLAPPAPLMEAEPVGNFDDSEENIPREEELAIFMASMPSSASCPPPAPAPFVPFTADDAVLEQNDDIAQEDEDLYDPSFQSDSRSRQRQARKIKSASKRKKRPYTGLPRGRKPGSVIELAQDEITRGPVVDKFKKGSGCKYAYVKTSLSQIVIDQVHPDAIQNQIHKWANFTGRTLMTLIESVELHDMETLALYVATCEYLLKAEPTAYGKDCVKCIVSQLKKWCMDKRHRISTLYTMKNQV